MGAAARAHRARRGSDPAPRASDSDVSQQRVRSGSSAGIGAGEGSDTQVMKRREFIRTVGRAVGLTGGVYALELWPRFSPSARPPVSPSLLVPMDDAQTDHLTAY